MEKIVYIVHCVDTEGPLYESLEATAERVEKTFGLKYENFTPQKLLELQKGVGLSDDIKESVMNFLSPEKLHYKTTWDEVTEMIDELMTPEWRNKYKDDFGNGYTFSWFILDHVGFHNANPRRRALGYHAIYDFYQAKLKHTAINDRMHWHYHSTPFFYEANQASCNFSFSNEHLQVLSRRVIDKLDFPAAYRPGLHTERPDINLFLEQWIPVDYGSQGMEESENDKQQKDITGGRYGDWRRAPTKWGVYHPDFYDYQKEGSMKRYLTRCLNLKARLREITKEEIVKAFEQADTEGSTILSITNHDQKEIRDDVDEMMQQIYAIQRSFPDVKIKHIDAVEAVRENEKIMFEKPTKFDITLTDKRIDIIADKAIWGPQPYFCFKTMDKRYIHENLDYQGGLHWSYVFDADTITLPQIEKIGVATNDNYANGSIYVIDVATKEIKENFKNA